MSKAPLNLKGFHLLLVGGRRAHAAHLRQLVTACKGHLTHHDGGMEDSLHLLPGLFARADAVLFPVTCISHCAQNEVKKQCRQHDIPYLPLRSSGVGAFVRALESWNEMGKAAHP